ncbi:hypothetical protein [Lysobacter enzymogenes]|jgi:hypothetical protein|uniref:hypothetical protein n=1 Tax=Lysobacter enzymogenes TaxID=69 RepID=UPI00089614C9|nr:hypothetical protein [Lysobacter enzymogenes]SDX27418.1 hypothetical protein SAMN05421681_104443 [Lysobacter enzymogenes]
MPARHRRFHLRLGALAVAAFGFAAALTATAAVPDCAQCMTGYYDCRAAGYDADSCRNDLFFCQRVNRCPLEEPPEI